MTPERRREIARMGGRAVQAQGKGHTFTREEAAAAGRKGGKASARRRGN
jgi:general stress protein YciG